jgi:transcriptional regulator with XRE-family HTH domain
MDVSVEAFLLFKNARFGAALRRARLARGWTITKLAQRSGLNAQYLGVVEAGRNVPTLYVILEVCEVLGVDAGELIREVADARRQPRVLRSPSPRRRSSCSHRPQESLSFRETRGIPSLVRTTSPLTRLCGGWW